MGAAKKTSIVTLVGIGALALAILATLVIFVGGLVKVFFFPGKEGAGIGKHTVPAVGISVDGGATAAPSAPAP